MSIPNAEKMITRAQNGEKLPRRERLHCIAYMMSVMPTLTNREIGEMFGITERAVRQDKRTVKEERASQIKEEDIALVIADIAISYDCQIRDIEKSKGRCKLGTRDYLSHCKTLFDMQREKVEALQNLGFYPKNLGNMTVEKFEYVATVASDNSVITQRKVDIIDGPKQLKPPETRNLLILDAEFSNVADKEVISLVQQDNEQSTNTESVSKNTNSTEQGDSEESNFGVTSSSPETV